MAPKKKKKDVIPKFDLICKLFYNRFLKEIYSSILPKDVEHLESQHLEVKESS